MALIASRFTAGQLKLQHIIESIGLETILEKMIGGYIVDIYLPEFEVTSEDKIISGKAVEFDGPFHHKKRDNKRDNYLLNEFGVKILRVKDVNDPDLKAKIEEFLNG
jgi:very-short-patch-repair endonuclease